MHTPRSRRLGGVKKTRVSACSLSTSTLDVTCSLLGILLVLATVAQASENGRVRRARLGVSTTDVSGDMQKLIRRTFDLEGEAGVIVEKVAENGPAAKAGMRKGDLILRVGSTLITEGRHLATTIARLRPGQRVVVTFARDITVHKARVTLGVVGSDQDSAEAERGAQHPTNPVGTLFDASARGDADRVASLIEGGVDVRARNRQGQVPLHAACAAGHTRAAKLLIDADQVRAKAELRGTVIPDFDEYMRRANPTLAARDSRGDTPLHAAARNGKAAAAKLLVESGADRTAKNQSGQTAGQVAAAQGFAEISDVLGDGAYTYDPPVVEPRRRVTRYAPKLKELVIRVQDIQRRLGRAGSAPQATVAQLGGELLGVGTDLEKLLTGSPAGMTRFGTFEEADLIASFKEAHDQSARMFQSLALVKIETPQDSTGASPSRNEMRQLLRNTGRMLIEEEAAQWMRKNGLEALLVENGYNLLRGEVSRGIELNLRSFLDKKSTELIGMPLGGFRSVQAAFRLQARRAVREVVADLILNISGNQLVVRLLQRHLVHWVEKDLWPQLREAFRPKTRLDRRVRISKETMEQASEDLNRLVQGRDPTRIPIAEVSEALERAEGKIHAARHLKRDLKRAENKALSAKLQAAEDRLQRDMRRIKHQYLLGDEKRWKDMGDNMQYIWGMHAYAQYILQAMAEERQRLDAVVQRILGVSVNENVEGVMALIHEQSPHHSAEAAARLRQYFATHTTVSDGFEITKVFKQSDQDAKVTIVETVRGSSQTFSLIFRRSGQTWKLYGPG